MKYYSYAPRLLVSSQMATRIALLMSVSLGLSGSSLAADQTRSQLALEGDEETIGGLTWRLEATEWLRQESVEATSIAAELTRTFKFDASKEEEKASRNLSSKLLGTKKFTTDGMWVVVGVNETELPPIIRSSEPEDLNEVTPAPDAPIEQWPEDGESVEWRPYSWTAKDCPPPSGDTQVRVYDGESRSLANMSHDRPQTTVRVVFNAPDGFFHLCTGVVIREQWVLTAAHCLFDSNNSVPTAGELYVYKPWSPGSTRYADKYFINQDFTPVGTDFDDDYALIKLEFATSGPDMDLSDHNDSTLQGVGPNFHSLQIPEWILNTVDTCTSTNLSVVHSANNEVTAFQSIRLRWRGDISQGASGSALYFCPEGSNSICGGGEVGNVVSILAGYTQFYERAVGPRVSEWFDWAQTIMDTE